MLVSLLPKPPPLNLVHSFGVLSLSEFNHSMLPILWTTALECLTTWAVTLRCRQNSEIGGLVLSVYADNFVTRYILSPP
jgi:hypothetical protein